MRTKRWLLATVALGISAGCGSEPREPELEQWSVSETPVVSIGAVDGDSAYLFQQIADLRFTPDGRIVVADQGLDVLRIFDGDGRFVLQAGGQGDGPGEFQDLRDLWIRPPDTIGVWDVGARRLTYFGADGAVERTVQLDVSGTAAEAGNLDFVAGALDDGSLAVGALALAEGGPPGADRVWMERFGADGRHLGRLIEGTGFIRDRLANGGIGPIAFSPYPHFATDGRTVYHTNGYASAVTVWSGDTEQRTIVFPAVEHDLEGAWSTLETELERLEIELYLEMVATAPRPDSIPSLAGLLVDDAGRLWAKQYDPATDALWLGGGARPAGGSWWVADAEGTLVARADVPAGFAPVQVEEDRVLGISVDDLGVERVEVRALSRR
jgi:hypothetical protein